MLNPKLKKYADRISALIDESKRVAALERPSGVGPYIQDTVALQSWLTRTKAIVELTFGSNSPHLKEFVRISAGHMEHSYEVNRVQGFLEGALEDLKNGFLVGQEFIVAGMLFDSVLDEATHLNESGHKDASAVLTRVVLEDSLRRIARRENIADAEKASKINDDLRKLEIYSQPMWRQIQAWLDIGNSAAHGKFGDYDQEQVRGMIAGVLQFISVNFS